MEIVKKPLGLYKTNCYVVKEGDQSIVIDPGFHAKRVGEMIGHTTPLAVVLTHGHCDHVCAVDGVCDYYHIPVYMNKGDEELLHAKRRMPSAYKGLFQTPFIPLEEGTLQIGPFTIEVMATPGHSAGSMVLRIGDDLFTGDTLFKGTVGTTNNYNGNKDQLKATLEKIRTWNPNWRVHPGHAEDTTIGEELTTNPFLLDTNEVFRHK